LLDHLVRERAVNDLEDEGIAGLEIRDIETLALSVPFLALLLFRLMRRHRDQVMQINADALLYEFGLKSRKHSNSKQLASGLRKREPCFSSFRQNQGRIVAVWYIAFCDLFLTHIRSGTLNTTKTTLGRALLRTWLLRPSLSLSVIKARHDAVACFTAPENLVPAHAMQGHLKGIKNVPRILEIMRSGKAKMSDWQGLVKFTFHSAMLRDNLSELHHAGHVEIVKKVRLTTLMTTHY
jgi:DNA mismatch repair protein MSH5